MPSTACARTDRLANLSAITAFTSWALPREWKLERRLVEIAWTGDTSLPRLGGVIQLGPLKEFRHQVKWMTLPKLGISFPANVVQGIGLSEGQVEALVDAGLYGRTD